MSSFSPPVGGRADPLEALGEGHILAGRDAQIAHLVAERALKRGEPLRQPPSRHI
jgi:hypothetical protein